MHQISYERENRDNGFMTCIRILVQTSGLIILYPTLPSSHLSTFQFQPPLIQPDPGERSRMHQNYVDLEQYPTIQKVSWIALDMAWCKPHETSRSYKIFKLKQNLTLFPQWNYPQNPSRPCISPDSMYYTSGPIVCRQFILYHQTPARID